MIMQLLKDGVPVLTAKSKHTINNSSHFFPITYEGDRSLSPNLVDEISVDLLNGIFLRIALENGFELSGDYHHMINNIELVWNEKDNL
jgi:hypothetical protein